MWHNIGVEVSVCLFVGPSVATQINVHSCISSSSQVHYLQMSLVTRKPVFRVCDQVRHKLACTATEAKQRLGMLDKEIGGIILSRQRTTKVLIRLRNCAGCSAPLLFAYGINRFSHDVAQMERATMFTSYLF